MCKKNLPTERGPRPVQVHKDDEQTGAVSLSSLLLILILLFRPLLLDVLQATKRTGQFLKQLEKKEGKETKRETLLKQVKDVDELMNEENSKMTSGSFNEKRALWL